MVRLLESATRDAAMREELAHVVTIRLSTLSEFAWPASGVPVVMKRALNGRYRSLLQEDAVTFPVCQYVGFRWAAAIKSELVPLLRAVDLDRVGDVGGESLHSRRLHMRQRCMLLALPDSLEEDAAAVDSYDDGAVDRSGVPEWGEEPSPPAEKRVRKQDLLRLLCTEAHLSAMVSHDSSFTAVSTDLESFGPSAPHEAVLAVLEFLGVPPAMCAVFETHMKMPLRFPGASRPETMTKGVAAARMLSRFFSELLLFVMDVAAVCAAWREIHVVADAFKLKLNDTKTGAVAMGRTAAAVTACNAHETPRTLSLPTTPIRWGMLELQADASVRIVASQVDWFAHELAQKLDATTCVLRWTTVYNKYMAFFLRNLGDASAVFGVAHVDEMVQAVRRIHAIAFACHGGDVLTAVRATVAAAFPEETARLSAAWVFWPLEHGGLGLLNPFLGLWSQRATLEMWRSADDVGLAPFASCRRELVNEYNEFLELVEENGLGDATRARYGDDDLTEALSIIVSKTQSDAQAAASRTKDVSGTTFDIRPLSEFLRHVQRSDKYYWLRDGYVDLLKPVDVNALLARRPATAATFERALASDEYWKWVARTYSDELVSAFGTLEFFRRELLPTQLVDEIKRTGIYWS